MSTSEVGKRRSWTVRVAPWVGCVAICVLVVLATTHWRHWTSNRTIQTTQNAFVKSNFAILSARVSGYINVLPVGDYQAVQAGDIIAQIDDVDIRLKISAREAAQAKAQAELENLDREVTQQRARIEQTQAKVRGTEVRVHQYQTSPERQSGLVQEGALSRQVFERAQADLDHAESQHDEAVAELELANTSLSVLEGQRAVRRAELDAATADLEAARHDLDYTRIVAPFDGVIGKLKVQRGSLVTTGTQIVSLVPSARPYIIANYKETQLAHVMDGQPVELTVDALPEMTFRGRVAEISPMSGGETALLPADNASGNFTKVVQRIPVRIELEPGQESISKLRPGMSAETSINTEGKLIASYPPSSLEMVSSASRKGAGQW
ncbi:MULTISPECIES: HlyD family secretion protein [Halomonadaceae]|uniref:HlyD family secretion protein n=1 Tax=Halomonadaceae TaxID=28256 RepID=UPI0012F2637A|nr:MULTISPECIES: HlyD family secretion protein [Halomonas]CAD5269417.1 Membrane fusion component of tripartite multidrug resistance system [Halomonas sp. I3]CAD5275303.1 Membrane fusion component of tripartite multidrug resistance system [Halomonas sp. 113]CAD5276600.1 Membrane fusion component of tripartite multidrug resistance system [Halomonas sp. 156]CAD5277060.1 Membrane fusion component of tripartite multidrug resistance system [Halomonas sp. 59]VXB99842.1 Membrane fusion component of tr